MLLLIDLAESLKSKDMPLKITFLCRLYKCLQVVIEANICLRHYLFASDSYKASVNDVLLYSLCE